MVPGGEAGGCLRQARKGWVEAMRIRGSLLVLCGVLVGMCGSHPAYAAEQTLPVKSVSTAAGLVHQVKVTNDQVPDTSTLKSIIESVTRDCKTNDEKAVAIYNVNQLFNYHRAYPEEPGLVSAAEGIQRLRLESVRRAAHRAVGLVAGDGLEVALPRLARPHHR